MAQRGRPPIRRRKKGSLDGNNLQMWTPEITGYVCRWVNDVKNRIHQLHTADDWDFVTVEEIADPNREGKPLVGEVAKNNDLGQGNFVCMRTGRGEHGPMVSYLMKKRKEFVRADEAEKQKRLDEIDKQLQRGISPVEKQYGKVEMA